MTVVLQFSRLCLCIILILILSVSGELWNESIYYWSIAHLLNGPCVGGHLSSPIDVWKSRDTSNEVPCWWKYRRRGNKMDVWMPKTDGKKMLRWKAEEIDGRENWNSFSLYEIRLTQKSKLTPLFCESVLLKRFF